MDTKGSLGLIRTVIALAVTGTWMGLNFYAASSSSFSVDWPVHMLFGVVLGSLFPEGAKFLKDAIGAWRNNNSSSGGS